MLDRQSSLKTPRLHQVSEASLTGRIRCGLVHSFVNLPVSLMRLEASSTVAALGFSTGLFTIFVNEARGEFNSI
jgi:hypothetical protein